MLLDYHEIFRNYCKSDILLTLGQFRLPKFYFQDHGVHFDVKYFFDKITVT